MPMLETNRLSVRYGTKTIVDSLSFSVSEGQWLMIGRPGTGGRKIHCALRHYAGRTIYRQRPV